MKYVTERDDIEIIVSNNGSKDNASGYEQIRDLCDTHVVYNRFDENRQFYGNYNAVVKLAKGHYCLLVSDEDIINENILIDLLCILEDYPDLGIIKAKTSIQYSNYQSGYAKAGFDALKEFFMQGNYISGTVYNRDYVTDELIDGLCRLYEEEEAYRYYPHLFVEGVALNVADFYFFDKCLITEGKEEGDKTTDDNTDILPFSTWESRICQLSGLLKFIGMTGTDNERRELMFRIAVWKTIWLIRLVRDDYIRSGAAWNAIYESSAKAILQEVAKCNVYIPAEEMPRYLQISAELIKGNV